MACLVGRSDGGVMILDLAQRYTSKTFGFADQYVEAGNYWQLRRPANPLGLYRKIQVWDEHQLVGGIFSNLGIAYMETGHLDQALTCCTKAVELNPKLAEGFNNRANVYGALGQFDRAISDYNKAIELNPQCAGAFDNRGMTYACAGKHELALADCNKAIELNPNMASAYLNRAQAQAGLAKTDDAKKDLQRALALDATLKERAKKISDQFKLGL